jgi:hypothetical protein
MGAETIGAGSIVPVSSDLTLEDLSLSILRGLENMHRVDKKRASGVDFLKGEWAVVQDDGTLARPASVPVRNTFLVFAGSDRFDAAATGQCTIIMSSSILVKTNRYDTAPTYHVGDQLTVKDLGGGEAFVTKQSGTEAVLAQVEEIGANYLVYSVRAQ